MKAHLLFEARDHCFDGPLPPNHEELVQDLELATLFSTMARGDRFLAAVAKSVVLASVDDPEVIRYRQDVLADCLAHPDVVHELYDVSVHALEDKRGIWGYSTRFPASILSGALSQLEASVVWLEQLRAFADAHVATFRSQGMRTLLHTLQRDLDDDYLATVDRHLKQLRFRGGELISMELDRDNSGINYVLRAPGEPQGRWKERLGLGARRSYSFSVAPRDEAGANALADIVSRGVNLVANAAAQSADHIMSYFSMLRSELGFYLGCVNLHAALTARGQPVCMPDPEPWDRAARSCIDLRDASLALLAEGPVVGNDVDADGKTLLIVTGANSGGKSTFLRSVGQAQLMLQCGMFVVAASYRASVAEATFTHFIREEDQTMTSGRLDEELSRMSTIADQLRPQSLVLFNESFAATNEREGSEIGRHVVRALLESDVRVCFVTHQFDFADGFRRERAGSTLFLRAVREDDGRRTFKLQVADPLPTSFGEDLYWRIGGWLGEDGPSAPGAGVPAGPPAGAPVAGPVAGQEQRDPAV